MKPASRRDALATLAGFLAVPAVPAVARPALPQSDEARLLALAPQLLDLLEKFDAAWQPCHASYEKWQRACSSLSFREFDKKTSLPEWFEYLEMRRPADEICEAIDLLYEPFMDIPLSTLPGIVLRHRIGISIDAYEDDAGKDLERLAREGVLCA